MPGRSPLTIGKYQVESELGRGGFGLVYKAFDPTVGRPVAIKILTPLNSPDMVARFQTEASATGNLHHPNIVTIYEFGVQEGSPYIAMEYLEGQDLQQVIAAGQPLTLLDKVRIMTQVGQGLQCAHENGVVHRDVKPANIRVLPSGNVKVMDFGIARLVHDNSQRLTQSGILIGTILYMSPEQFRGQDADALCDIFSYGLVFYELLSGKYPFQAPNAVGVMARVVGEQPASLTEAVPGCPLALEQVVMRALEKNRELRYQSFADLLLDLQTVLLDLQRERAAELLGEARDLLSSGRTVEAQAIVRNIMDLDPTSPEARQLRDQVQQSLREMSAQSRIEANLKAVESQIVLGLFPEAIVSLESALRLYPDSPEIAKRLEEARRLQEQRLRAQPRRTEEPPSPSGKTQPAAGRKADQTLLVDPKKLDLPSPPPEESAPEPPQDFTSYFPKPESDEPLTAYVMILSCPDSFREGHSVPVRSSPFTIGRSEGDLLIMKIRRYHASMLLSPGMAQDSAYGT